MDFHRNHHSTTSPTSSASSTTTTTTTPIPNPNPNPSSNCISTDDPMHSWWESISKARSRIHSLSSLLPPSLSSCLCSLADSDRPALSLLSSLESYDAVSSALFSPLSGSGSDPLCHWLYDTFLSSDPHLRLVVFSFLPVLSGLYLSRVHSLSSDSPSLPSLAGFEAVLLALYAAETKARNGKPVVVSIPDLSQPSLYHTPRVHKPNPLAPAISPHQSIGVLSPPLEPQIAVKSTKRACIVGVALDSYYKHISQMPTWSKIDFCRFLASWAGQDCHCLHQVSDDDTNEPDITPALFLEGGNEIDDVTEEMDQLMRFEKKNVCNGVVLESKGSIIPLPWELLQPALRIVGHCLLAPLNSQDIKDAASVAVKRLYARASHDLVPQAILATQSLIQLDKRARESAKATAVANSSSNANTPSKAKNPEVLLVSK
ncbi:hypothetical protein PRUPE_8G059200 [Prunus persica]|uniref:Hyccin n=1 Tax=Prunus persica TaxID=3760 RepID=A0A251MTV7_PRUPE|nr:uncharacterized protein LOC18787986 [Prunus persica]ONH90523.1 hypothetical protein PRUPE_8G059200 [Prunus persica]